MKLRKIQNKEISIIRSFKNAVFAIWIVLGIIYFNRVGFIVLLATGVLSIFLCRSAEKRQQKSILISGGITEIIIVSFILYIHFIK